MNLLKIPAAGLTPASLPIIRSVSADVTVQEQMSLDASIMKAHITQTSYFSGDKKRHEYLFACDGMMKLLCASRVTRHRTHR